MRLVVIADSGLYPETPAFVPAWWGILALYACNLVANEANDAAFFIVMTEWHCRGIGEANICLSMSHNYPACLRLPAPRA